MEVVDEYFDVEPRDYSSNVVVHVTKYVGQRKGKTTTELVKRVIVVPTEKKVHGDMMATFIASELNKKL